MVTGTASHAAVTVTATTDTRTQGMVTRTAASHAAVTVTATTDTRTQSTATRTVGNLAAGTIDRKALVKR